MVFPRQNGEEKNSPHSIESFREQNPSKMVRDDIYWIIILPSMHLGAFKVEKVEE